jgi:hypothetical protein
MATNQSSPAELKEALSLLKQLKKGYAELGGVNPFANFNADNIQDIITQAGGVENILTDWTLELDKVEDNLESIGKSAKSVYQQFNNIVGELKKTNQNITLGNKSMNAFQKTAEKLKDDQQGITRLSKTELENLQKQNKQALSNLDIANQALQQQIDNNELVGDELLKAQALVGERNAEATAIKDLINLTNERLEKEKEIEKTLGIAPKLLEGLKKIPIIGDVLDIKGAQNAMIEAAEGGASGFQAMGAGVKALGPSLKAALGPLALISLAVEAVQMLIGAMLDADKQVTDIAQNFNIIKEDAADTRDRFFELSDNAGKFGKIQEGNLILQKDLVKYNMELNEALGTSIDLSSNLGEEGKKIAVQFANASKFLKLGADEQKGLMGLTATTGKYVDNTTKNILGTVRLRKLESGILLDERKILKDVLTASNAIKLSVKGGAEGLTNAAFAAARLGSDLSKVESMSKSFLNFEESISAEMEAELLTGKDLNLETARRAALNGDIETVAKEINRQIGTSADFSRMNVIQQEALAKAMGTSREELSDMLVQQESLNKLKGTFNALSDEQLKLLKDKGKIDQLTYERLKNGTASAGEYYDSLKRAGLTTEELTSKLGDASLKALESQSAQDKFNDTLEKVKESFSRAFTGETIDKFADTLADFVKRWSEDGLFSAIFNSGGTPPTPEEKMASSGVSQSEIKQIKNDEVVTAPRGPKFANGGVITKPVYNATIGEAGPEAVIPLGELMKHFNAMNNTLNAILQKDSNIYLDGTKVGTAMNVSTRRVQ